MHTLSQTELDEILKQIDSGAYGEVTYKYERLTTERGRDLISIPNEDSTARRLYERKDGEEWKEVPFLVGKSEFE